MIKRKRGTVFVVSAPSGAGKTTLCKRLVEDLDDIVFSVSYTTRPPRKGEVNGVDYFFVDENRFREMVDRGEFLEWALVHGHLYGTSKRFVMEKVENGIDVILDIDVQGAEAVFSKLDEAVGIFIFVPSMKELKKRLLKRATDPIDVIEKRLSVAEKEIRRSYMFRYWVMNDDLERAYLTLKSIVFAERAVSSKMELLL